MSARPVDYAVYLRSSQHTLTAYNTVQSYARESCLHGRAPVHWLHALHV